MPAQPTGRTPLMAGNWKMNLDHFQATHLVQKLDWTLRDGKHDFAAVEVVVLPPFTDIRSVQTLIYIPHFLAWTIVAALTYLLFAQGSGVLFNFFNGVFGTHVDFLTSPGWFRPLIILQSIWKSTGWGTIIYLAALAGVDPNQYEAAVIDGAGRWSRMWHVTLPAIRGTIVVMLILSMGSILNTGFEQIYLMTNSLNRSVADVFDTYVYFVGISQGSYSYATAVGLFKAIVGVILIGGANWVAKRLGQDGIF